MKELQVEGIVSGDPDAVFADLADFPGYVSRAPSVRNVSMGEGNATSTWEVSFRNGVLRWVEQDTFDVVARQITFSQIEGDLESFEGFWRVVPIDDMADSAAHGSRIVFWARFDLGVPGLSEFLDPVAERALQENIGELLGSLFPSARVRTVELPDPVLDLTQLGTTDAVGSSAMQVVPTTGTR